LTGLVSLETKQTRESLLIGRKEGLLFVFQLAVLF
jgi:hypothetical protein